MKKIVMIEDNESIRQNTAAYLQKHGFNISQAEDGLSGIETIIEEKPDLVLCDVMMPEMNGYEVLQKVRANERVSNTPFIFLTAKIHEDEIRHGMQMGADDYLTKPLRSEKILRAIESRLNRQKIHKKEMENKMGIFKDQLSHLYSHELNTPLNGIIGFIDLIINSFDEFGREEILDMLGNVKHSAERLNRTTQNVILYASIQKFLNAPENSNFPAGDLDAYSESLALEVRQQFKHHGREKDLHIEMQDAALRIDYQNLGKIITELTDNACKFSQAGEEVKLESKIEGDFMKFVITDQGRGSDCINAKGVHAFRQFEAKKNATQGLGLGLYFVENLCKLTGSVFEIHSKFGEGTKAIVRIPLRKKE